jgi:hypothetical protein
MPSAKFETDISRADHLTHGIVKVIQDCHPAEQMRQSGRHS